jgi:diguanylate cyclase (GGDEF)-like protein
MSDSLLPRGPRARRALGAFLETSGTVLLGRIDGRGMVVAANPGLGRWLGDGVGGSLESALRPRSRLRWRRALAAGGPSRRLTLWFGPGATDRAAYRCRLVSETGGTFWLCGEPRPAAGPSPDGDGPARALRDELARYRRLAGTDALTGLANRRFGLRRLAAMARRARRHGTPLACLMVDLDRFKAVNTRFGHPAGDRVLRAAARTLADGLRGSDLMARYGGDEFLIVLPATTAADALSIADRLRERLAGRRLGPLDEPLGAGFGVAELSPGESARSLLARADAALIRSKREDADGTRGGR